jgi:hypothetical protein
VNDRIILPNTGTAYDPNVAQDHTDQQFRTSAQLPEKTRRDPKFDAALLMKAPAWMKCPGCGSAERWRVLADSSPESDGLIQLHCGCGQMTPVLALGQPQVTNYIARKLGISVPDPTFDFTVDLRD